MVQVLSIGLDGAGVKPQELSECSILDVTPTVLSYLDSPIPSDLDGSPLQEAFSTSVLSISDRVPITPESGIEQHSNGRLMDRLKDLGYLE